MRKTYDHTALLQRYIRNVMGRNGGNPLLDSYAGFSVDELAELRRIGRVRIPVALP
jgi:hypothetical protein